MSPFGMDIQIKNDLHDFQKYNYSMKYTAALGASQKTSNIVTLEKDGLEFESYSFTRDYNNEYGWLVDKKFKFTNTDCEYCQITESNTHPWLGFLA